MQYNTTEELHIVMDHVPCYLITSGHPVVLINRLGEIVSAYYLHEIETRVSSQTSIHLRCRHFYRLVLGETAGGGLDDGISLRQNLIEHALVLFLNLFL